MNEDIKDYSNLIEEFVEQRNSLKKMINDLEEFKVKIDTLLPDKIDKRFIRYFEEKIKVVTELFKAILDIRKEISKITKDEYELRRKLEINDDDEDISDLFDIKKIADRVDKLRKENILLEDTEKTINEKEGKNNNVVNKSKKGEF
jgi:hypothetical protein